MKRETNSKKLVRFTAVIEAKHARLEDLAHKTGLSIDTLRNAKRGKSVSHSTWCAIAKGLGVAREELV